LFALTPVFAKNEPVDVVIRPEDLVITTPEKGFVAGRVTDVVYEGAYYDIRVDVKGFEWQIQSVNPVLCGDTVGLAILPDNIQIMHKPVSADEEISKDEK